MHACMYIEATDGPTMRLAPTLLACAEESLFLDSVRSSIPWACWEATDGPTMHASDGAESRQVG